ncbi:hypothetical protein N6H18_11290 [Reichenbachiella agarivorans]|uniref:Type IX secretion system membrane protein, PorP/SprF family n=1 Tax=Reichenbachiella agarivorans TaxID=2979464 RepID=A0ABY6CK86_9BACT|nr:hypothetical protein [Reichenbachiella agarivorans]UXP30935.1 hypothetical protein N6H18_11290 [Reichenbachiella agarivorans]
MKTNLFILLGTLAIQLDLFGQNGDYAMGARSSAIAGTSVTISDGWALFNNIGALADAEKIAVFGSYRNLYGIPELSSIAAGATLPIWNGVFGVGVFRYGGDLLNEQRAHMGYSHRLGIVSLGLNLGYYQLNIENGGSTGNLMIDFGGRAELTKHLYFGAHVSNINQAKLSKQTGELVPTYMKTGLSYRPNSDLMLNTEVEKNLDDPLSFKIGMEYQIIEWVALRLGFKTEPFISNFGIGLNPKNLSIDYAYSIHPDLGGINQVSFAYYFGSKKSLE